MLSSVIATVRDLGGAPSVRRELIGTWELTATSLGGIKMPVNEPRDGFPALRMTLEADGNVAYNFARDGKSTWYMADGHHFHILHQFPSAPGMEEGEEKEYEIVSLSPTRLVVREHGFNHVTDKVYTRVGP